MHTTIPDRVARIRIVVENIKNEYILTQLKKFGLTVHYINNCSNKYNNLETLIEKQHSGQCNIRMAHSNFKEKIKVCRADYIKTLDFVRLKVKHIDGAKNRINTSRISTTPVESMFAEVLRFYNNVLREPELVNYLAQFNITPNTYINSIEEAKSLKSTILAMKGNAENATEKRNKALVELEDICNEIRTVAKYALKDNPQLLEQINIKVRS